MRVLDHKVLRELQAARGLLLAITSIIAIGVACYVANASCYRNLSTGLRQYYAECRMAHFSIELKKAPLPEIEALAQLNGVTAIRPRIQSYVTVDLENVVQPINGQVLSLPDRREPVINDILLRQGSYFTDRRENEVIVNEAFAREQALYPGGRIHLLLNNRRQELFIVGTAISSEFTYLVGPGSITPDPEHFGVFYIKRSFAEEVFDFEGAANQVVGLMSPGVRESPQEILRRAELILEPYGVFSTTPLADQASHRFVNNEIQSLRSFGMVMPSIFLAVAALVLNMLMTRLTEQQRVVVGTLKALGYSDLQVFAHFMKFGIAVGVAGGVLGAACGYGLAGLMTGVYQQFFQFPSLYNRLHFDAYLDGVLISVACALLGSFHGARGVLKLEPAEAMRPKPPAQGGAIGLERIGWLWRELGFAWRMTLRNVVRHRLRTLATMFAAAMGAAVCVNVLMMAKATDYMLSFQFELIQRSDVDLALRDEHSLSILNELRLLPGVDDVEPTLDVACTFANGSHTLKAGITGVYPGSRLIVPRDTEAQPVEIPEVGLAMTRKMAELLHLDRGDQVEIRPVKGLRRPRLAAVTEITDSYLGLSCYADWRYLNSLVNEEDGVTSVQMSVQGGDALRRELYHELKQMPAVQAITIREETIRNLNETLLQNQRVFITMLVMFAGVISFGSVLNSSLISLAERSREVATLRVLGYSPWQVGGLFLRESMLINIAGTLAGLPIGYLLSVGVVEAFDTDWFRLPLVDPGFIFIYTVLLGLLFALLAQALVQRQIHRFDWLEAMKTKE